MIRIGSELTFGSGNIALSFDSMGLYFIELDKSYPIGTSIDEEEDWLDHQTGTSILLEFKHEAEIHYLYHQLDLINSKNRSIEYGNVTLHFNGKHWKKCVDNFKNAIRVWINKKIECLSTLLDEGLEDKDFYKEYIV